MILTWIQKFPDFDNIDMVKVFLLQKVVTLLIDVFGTEFHLASAFSFRNFSEHIHVLGCLHVEDH